MRSPPAADWKLVFFFKAEDGIRDLTVTGVQTCALPICGTPRDAVHFSICDTGVGIPQETLLYIFEPLFTTKKFGGTGLGLAVASQVVQQHEGQIGRASCRERV